MKRTIIVMFILGLVNLAACSSSTSPADTMQAFYENMATGKINDAYQLMGTDTRKAAEMFGGVSVLSDKSKKIMKKGGISSITLLSEEVNGDMATVILEVTYGDGTKEKRTDKLLKENGEWRLTMNK